MIQTANKQSRIDIRVSDDIKAIIEKAARLTGKSTSSYIISKALTSAKEDIQQIESITLGDVDRNLFYQIIQAPPTPNKVLKSLMSKSYKIKE